MNTRSYRSQLLPVLVAAGLILTIFAPKILAQTPIDPMPPIDEPWPPPAPMPPFVPEPYPLVVERIAVSAVADGPVASVTVNQIFRNDSASTVEGTYIFPLPAGATPSSFQMTIDGEVVEGKIYSSDEARAIYEEIVRSLRDPALLEYLGSGLFQVSIFPIPPGEEREVELSYDQPLSVQNGLYRLDIPLKAHVPGAGAAEEVVIEVEMVNQPGLRTIYSPSHDVSVDRTGDDSAVVGFEGSGEDTQSDFTLYFGTDESAIGANLLSYKPAGEDGFFLLLVAPGVDAAADEVIARDIVVVLDVSGSMEGDKIEQAREAALEIVNMMNPDDRFNLITFSTGVDLWQNELQEVSKGNIDKAERWISRIDSGGSTDINRAMLEALDQVSAAEGDRPAYVLFLTDGLPTMGEEDPGQIIENALDSQPEDRSVRVFTFGVGYDVNTDLLNALSREMGGRATYVKPEQAIDEVVGDFYAQIGKPVLSDVTVTLDGDTVVDETYPDPLPDLFAGEQLVVAGRYSDGADVTVRINGKVNGRETAFLYPKQTLVERGGDSFVARLWATRKMGEMLEQVRLNGADRELVEAIIDLSLQYGIVSPYTSYLVLEPGMGQVVSNAGGNAPIPSLRANATEAAAAFDAVAAAPAAGEAAVVDAQARAALAEAETVEQVSEVRYVEGKAFTQRGWVEGVDGAAIPFWVDTAWDEEVEPERVLFASEEYFDLLQDERVARWLSLSSEMLVVLDDGSVVRISTVAP